MDANDTAGLQVYISFVVRRFVLGGGAVTITDAGCCCRHSMSNIVGSGGMTECDEGSQR